jgi:hypothetical protein
MNKHKEFNAGDIATIDPRRVFADQFQVLDASTFVHAGLVRKGAVITILSSAAVKHGGSWYVLVTTPGVGFGWIRAAYVTRVSTL